MSASQKRYLSCEQVHSQPLESVEKVDERLLTIVLYWSLQNRRGLKVALQRPFSDWEAHD